MGKMKKISVREIVLLVLTLGLTGFFIFFLLMIKPMETDAVDVDDQMRLSHERLLKAQQMSFHKPAVEARYQHLVDLIGVADSQEDQMTAMISKIESAAREANIHIANIQPQKAFNQKEVQFFPVELQIDGQWLDIVRFLYGLQQQPNYYFIDELNLEKYSDTAASLRGRIVVSCMRLLGF